LPVIDSARLVTDLAALAHDSMEGRKVGTAGGARARAYLQGRFAALGLDTLASGSLERFTASPDGEGANVIAYIPGTGRPGRVLLLTAHYDHLGVQHGEVYNGADDNASGTAAILAIAGWFRQHPPKHTLVFVALDGEESGLLGAHAFVRDHPVPLDSALLDVNLDMVSRSARKQLFAVGPKRYPGLLPYLASTACAARISLMLGHDQGASPAEDWTDQSDQGAFRQAGVPFIYFGVEDHPDYHQASDEVSRIDPGFYVAATRAITLFVSLVDADPAGAGLPVQASASPATSR
jgi:Zn-dependent M28 family amino/carboxypeptidase